jgi:hypothetical protein
MDTKVTPEQYLDGLLDYLQTERSEVDEMMVQAYYAFDPLYYSTSSTFDELIDLAEEAVIGEYDTCEDFGRAMADELGLMVPYELERFINWEEYGEELARYDFHEMYGYYFRTN